MDKVVQTHHLHIAGQVQGVGFRPFVWRLAQEFNLRGWVNNTNDGVQLAFTDTDGANTTNPIETVLAKLQAGKIIAVKGIGGYLLFCKPSAVAKTGPRNLLHCCTPTCNNLKAMPW